MALATHSAIHVAQGADLEFDHERLVIRRGRRSGLTCAVAVHSTTLGPALGGLRIWHYPEPIEGVADVLRLASGMTLKAAAAGLDLGGGKGVICAPAGGLSGEARRAALLDFGDLVESLGGDYISAEDVGVTPDDLVVIAERTSHLTGLPPERGGSGDPSPFTALGVDRAMRACLRERFGTDDPAGRRVVVVGLGHVGTALAQRLVRAGCDVMASDIDPERRAAAAQLGAGWIDPVDALAQPCDVLAPCALGGTIDALALDELRCEIVCGSANNQLAEEGLDEGLAERGILYAPDFIANAGGLIHVCMEVGGYGEQRAIELAEGIGATMTAILERARDGDVTPLRAASELAERRLAGALRH